MPVTTIISHSVGVEIIQYLKALDRLFGQRGAYELNRVYKCPLIFLIHFLDLKSGKGEWNVAQLAHVTVGKE